MLDSVFICKYSVRYTLASSSVSGFLSVACDGGSNPYPHLNNKQVNHTTYHYQKSMEFTSVSYYLTVILNSLQRFVKDLVPIQYRKKQSLQIFQQRIYK